jgi:signal transduction histidine kinase
MLMDGPAAIAVFRGKDAKIEIINAATIAILGKPSHELIGTPLLAAVPELKGQEVDAMLRKVMRTGSAIQRTAAPLRVLDGGVLKDKYVNFVCAPLPSPDGVDRVLTWGFEVTELVNGRRGAELARINAEAANRMKDEFLATMSHELRTPLNAILGWATLLRRDPRQRARIEHGLTVIERNAQAQAHLVSDLLDMSRIVSGKLCLAMKKCDVSAIVSAAADAVKLAAEAKGVRLVLDLDRGVGATVGDPDRLQQVVWNLLSNAVRFTPAKGTITVTAARRASVLRIRVKDTGAGIPPEHLPHIFERFRQIDSSTTRAQGGLGLGLAIVRHLVEAHGGTVSAHSDGLGLGATFTIDLPVPSVNVAPPRVGPPAGAGPLRAADESSSDPSAENPTPLDGVRILVVEDDQDSLELLRMVLEGAGATVTGVMSGKQALEEPGPFDLIISDIGMPEMDGYAFMRRFRATPTESKVPAIALTAYARFEDSERALASGYQQHIAKPVDAIDLLAVAERLVRSPGPWVPTASR